MRPLFERVFVAVRREQIRATLPQHTTLGFLPNTPLVRKSRSREQLVRESNPGRVGARPVSYRQQDWQPSAFSGSAVVVSRERPIEGNWVKEMKVAVTFPVGNRSLSPPGSSFSPLSSPFFCLLPPPSNNCFLVFTTYESSFSRFHDSAVTTVLFSHLSLAVIIALFSHSSQLTISLFSNCRIKWVTLPDAGSRVECPRNINRLKKWLVKWWFVKWITWK